MMTIVAGGIFAIFVIWWLISLFVSSPGKEEEEGEEEEEEEEGEEEGETKEVTPEENTQ